VFSIVISALDEIALTPSTTVALNDVGEGLVSSGALKAGDNVLTTDQEHGGGLATWQHWQRAGIVNDIDVVAVPGADATEKAIIEIFENALLKSGKQYRILAISHVLTTTGLRMPLSRISEICRIAGTIFIVDGAQAAGGIAVNLTDSGVDVYTISAHKWLLAPTGSGLLFTRLSIKPLITPTYFDGGYQGYSQSSGTVPVHTIAGLGYALDLFEHFGGLKAAEEYNMRLRARCYALLTALAAQVPGLVIISPPSSSVLLASPIISMNLPIDLISNSDVMDRLWHEYEVVVKLLPDHEGGTPIVVNAIRVSHHIFNNDADVDKLVHGLSCLLLRLECRAFNASVKLR
jgi:selenocysteine lyase/cysteine desulfurase